MNIFINTVKVIKYTIHKNSNTLLYYDYISTDDLSVLENNIKNLKFKTIYGTINKQHLSFTIIQEHDPDYNDIKSLLNNKLYNRNINIKDIILSLKNNIQYKDDDYDDKILSPKSKLTLEQLMITTEELNKDNKKNAAYNDVVLTEYLNSDSESEDDNIDNLVKDNISYTIDDDKIETERNI